LIMIALIDMEMGNLRSVAEAISRIGVELQVTDRPEDIARADTVILPGVGAFGDAMAKLRENALVDALRQHASVEMKPLLGICLGMQILADEGEEHGQQVGLGIISGRVVRVSPTQPGFRVPNVGWCDVEVSEDRILNQWIPPDESFYFSHSYHFECSSPGNVAATIDYSGHVLTVAVEQNNIFGVQFHPEKSQEAGLNFLDSFLQHTRGKTTG
jgi:glutamine amidotransferase